MAAGDFTGSALVNVLKYVDEAWSDSMVAQDAIGRVATANIVKNESQRFVRLEELQNPSKDYTVRVYWPKMCSESSDAGSDDCTVGGNELESDYKDYTLGTRRTWGFQIDEKALRSNALTFEQLVARGSVQADKILAEYLAQALITAMVSNAGTNLYTGLGSVAATETTVDATDWSVDGMLAHLALAGQKNYFTNPYLLTGSALWTDVWKARLGQPATDRINEAVQVGQFRWYQDIHNVDPVVGTDETLFMVNPSAITWINKAYEPREGRELNGAGQFRYSMPSRLVPGLEYDVVYTNDCSTDEITHKWSFYMKYGILINPEPCVTTNTGILSFVKDAGI
jgi:hypothetical protein